MDPSAAESKSMAQLIGITPDPKSQLPRELCQPPGYCQSYWNLNRDIKRADIERHILRNWDWRWSIDGDSPTGRTWAEHFMDYCLLCFPQVIQHPWFVRRINGIERARVDRNLIINWIGSQDSGKTEDSATVLVALMSINPSKTRGFVASPFKKASESIVWPRISTRIQQGKEAQPHIFDSVREAKAQERWIFDDSHPEQGYLALMVLDKVGKLQGMKSPDRQNGFILMNLDEVAEFPNKAPYKILKNFISNDNALVLTTCNFRDENGMEGELCQPVGREYDQLDRDEDQEWQSTLGSVTMRFDGHQSPNLLAGKTIYPFLIREHTIKALFRDRGFDGPDYLCQVRSFPTTSEGQNRVLTRDQVRSSGAYDDFVIEQGKITKVAAMDPGFGGDPCVIQAWAFANARVSTLDGRFYQSQVLYPISQPVYIKLEKEKYADQAWIDRMMKVSRNGTMNAGIGRLVDMNDQIAVIAAEYLDKWGIERSNFIFDGSMRAGVVHKLTSIIGHECMPVDIRNECTERRSNGIGRHANELYPSFASELYFAFQSLVFSGQLRGADMINAALTQMYRRITLTKGDKEAIESKGDYKKAHHGKSPDEADTAVLALEAARRRGFEITFNLTPSSQRDKNLGMVLDRLMQGKGRMFNRFGGKKLKGAI